MHIEIFSLCDAAAEYAGKLSILGVFDTIWAKQCPIAYPQCAIALRIRFTTIERGDHKIVVHCVDLDGKHMIPPAEGVVSIQFPDDLGSAGTNFILNIQQLKLENFGEHAIRLAIDGREEAILPLFFKKRD